MTRAKTQSALRNKKDKKLEIRNSKQIQMIKKHKFQTGAFRISISDLTICFGFRASDFGF